MKGWKWKNRNVYALYRDDTYIDMGTLEYLAEKIGVSLHAINFYLSPTYLNRTKYHCWVLVKVGKENDYDE